MIMTGVSSPLWRVAGVAEDPPLFDPDDTVNREVHKYRLHTEFK